MNSRAKGSISVGISCSKGKGLRLHAYPRKAPRSKAEGREGGISSSAPIRAVPSFIRMSHHVSRHQVLWPLKADGAMAVGNDNTDGLAGYCSSTIAGSMNSFSSIGPARRHIRTRAAL